MSDRQATLNLIFLANKNIIGYIIVIYVRYLGSRRESREGNQIIVV